MSIERETFPQIIASGKGLYAYTTSDYWIDLGKPEQYLNAHRDVLAGRMPLLTLEPGATGEGASALAKVAKLHLPVHADAGIQVDPTAEIGPNVVLGEGCRIESGAILRDSVLWDRVTIEEGAIVEGAILASGVRVGRDARIHEGSVVGHDAVVAANETLGPDSRVGASAPITR